MKRHEAARAITAAMSAASALGLAVDDAEVLNDSNRLVVHLTPSGTVVRVTPTAHHAGHQVSPEREVDVVKQLMEANGPVAALDTRVDARVLEHDGFAITFWAYYKPMSTPSAPDAYAPALRSLHDALSQVKIPTPHAMDRVAAVRRDVASRAVTPDLEEADRDFLAGTLRELTGSILSRHAPEQLLHGEPHSMNLLSTDNGPLFIDFENTARGPIEYDLGWVPQEVGELAAGADQDLVDQCRGLVLAMVAAYRWRSDDQHPSGRASGLAFLHALRDGPPWRAINDVVW